MSPRPSLPDRGPFPASDVARSILVETDVEIPMRDGVVLRADLYRPAGDGRVPVLVSRTPYSKELHPGLLPVVNPVRAARAGFAVLVQDTRGRNRSEGEFRPFADEAADGHDTVVWAARQPWSNGRVGMFGSSYMGATQLQAATRRPEGLEAVCPVQASSDYYEGRSYWGGAFELGALATIALWSQGIGTLQRRVADPRGLSARVRELRGALSDLAGFLSATPLEGLQDTILGEVSPAFFEWLEHDHPDAYWDALSIEARYGDVDAAALHVTSWYDPFHVGTLRNYEGLRASAATEAARDGQHLIVGPWTHYAPRTAYLGTVRVGEMDAGFGALVELEGVQIGWFRCRLRDEPDAFRQRKRVRIFVMGRNEWRDEDEWPLASAEVRALFLDGSATRDEGRLTWERPAASDRDEFEFDPANPVPTTGGAHLVLEASYPAGALDQRGIESRDDVLVYTGAPLTEDLDVIGWVTARLHVASSAPSTDFTVKLVDVAPDGRALNICDGIRRVTLPETGPDAWHEVEVSLGATAMCFRRGHRLRVQVSSSNFPRFDVNPNTGEPSRTATTRVVAHQRIALGGAAGSHVLLPVLPVAPGGS